MNVSEACRTLASYRLVPWSSGNASMRVGNDMDIKASGVHCSKALGAGADPEHIARVRLSDGRHVLSVKPSTDSEAHRWIYNHLPSINGVCHTHSTYCTTFAVAQKPIPCASTMQEDVFGGEIPISSFCHIGDEEIGKEVVRLYESTKVPAVLIRSHGLFTVGDTLEHAVRAAVLAEECAKVAYFAMRMGNLYVRSAKDIAVNHRRYNSEYGQSV